MTAKQNIDLQEAIAAYDQEMMYRAEEARIRAEERANSQQNSGGGSLLVDIGKIAIGSAIGSRIAQGRPNDGSGRQNLFGTPGCCQARAVGDKKRGPCNACPQQKGCTMQGTYKVGSKMGF